MSPSAEVKQGHDSQPGDKRSRRHRASASPNRRSPVRSDSRSPLRSPSRHKHSKRHKKEHSHKRSNRDRHNGSEHPDHQLGVPEVVNTAAESDSKEGAVADDLDALRQAALQTTKNAVGPEPGSESAEQPAAADIVVADVSSSPVNTSVEAEHMETA